MPVTPFIVVVPARLGSTRLPNKPLADIAGVPLVIRVARNAAASAAARVIVAADSEAIRSACAAYGVDCVLTDPDHPSGTDRIAEAVRALQLAPQSIVVNVQGDEPLLPPAVIDAVAAALATRNDCEIATAAHPITKADEFFSPNVVKVTVDNNARALYFSRAPIPWARDAFAQSRDALPADLPAALPALRHVGIYAYRGSFLLRFASLAPTALERHEALEQLRALGHGVGIAVVTLEGELPAGVDTADDLVRVRALYTAAADARGDAR